MSLVVPQDTTAFRAVLDSVFAAPAYRWAETAGFLTKLREWWHALGEWLRGLQVGSPFLFRLLIVGLLLLLLVIFAHAAYVAYRTIRVAAASPETLPERDTREPRDATWYRREADRAAAEGRLLDALQLAFVALALGLEAEGLLRYQTSMTPAECAVAARLTDADRARLRQLVGTLYAHVFGGRPCGREDYELWRAASAPPWHATSS